MHDAIGHRTRKEIFNWLFHSDEMGPKELEEAIESMGTVGVSLCANAISSW